MKTPNLKTEDVILCCVVRVIAHFRWDDRWVWSNDGIIISRVNTKKLGDG
jgi:hypothetical protein